MASLAGFSVDLSANLAGFTSDLGRANRIAEQQAKAIAGTIGKALSILAVPVGVGAFVGFIGEQIKAADAANELSQKIGVQVESIAGLSLAAKQSGVEVEGLQKGMIKLAQSSAAAAGGAKDQAATYRALGITVTDANGHLKASDVLLGEVADKLAGYRDGTEKTVIATKLFGKAGAELIPMLNGGAASLREYQKIVDDLGLSFTQKGARAADEFGDSLDVLKMVPKGVANVIATELTPALADLAKKSVEFFRSQQWKDWLNTIKSVAASVADNMDKIVAGIKLIGELAAVFIGAKLVNMLLLATANMVSLTMATIAANSALAEMGVAAGIASKGMAAQFASSVAASVASIGLIPLALGTVAAAFAGWKIGEYLSDNFLEARLAGIAFVDGVLTGWEKIKQGAALWFAATKYGFGLVTDFVMGGIAKIATTYAEVIDRLPGKFGEGMSARLREFADSVKPAFDATSRFKMEIIGINAESKNAIEKIHGQTNGMVDYEIAAAAAAEAAKLAAAGTKESGDAAKGAAPNVAGLSTAQEDSAKQATALAAAQQKLADIMSKLDGDLSPVNKAWADFANTAQDAVEAARKAIENHGDEAATLRTLELVMAKATAAREKDLAAIKKQGDVLGNYMTQLGKDKSLLGLTDRQKAIAIAVQNATDKFNANSEAHIANAQTLEQLSAEVAKNEGLYYDQAKAVQHYGSIADGVFNSLIDSSADWLASGLKNAKDFWRSMGDMVKRAVAQMLAEWAKTKIIGYFQNNGTASSASLTSLLGISTASPQATGGFQYNGGGFSGNGMLSSYGSMAGSGSAGGGMSSAVGAAAPWAGAALGAYYGAGRGDGGIGTYAGIAAGAIAGYYAGTVALGYLTAGIGTAATAATATTAAAAGTGAMGAATAIPVIGWVLAIILAIDAVSGGKVLGTKYRPETSRTQLSFNDMGASAEAGVTEWKYRRNILQWNPGGSIQAMQRFGEKDRREKELPITAEMLAMIDKLFAAFKKTYVKAAEALNTEVAAIVDGTFETITKYTKKGKVKSEKTQSMVLGKIYEESFEDFQARMHAEGIIATLNQVAEGASKLADVYRANAKELMDAAATMLQGQVDMNAGKGLLFMKQDLAEMMKRVEDMRSGDEKLIETYMRLAQATAQYREIITNTDEAMRKIALGNGPVDQMKEALLQLQKQLEDNSAALQSSALAAGAAGAAEADLAKLRALNAAQIAKISTDFYKAIDDQLASLTDVATPSNDFRAAMRAINDQLADNIGQANLLAKAMGQQGISAENLAKIFQLAARQAAAAIAQLVNIGKAQAHSLGYTGPQNLSELDAAIADLQGRAGSASSSINDFGGAIGAAAEAADNAINLLLGSLSPLNDQQKLQTALGGLYAGTVSQEQVLEIGRRLFASTSQYTALFNQVMAVGPRAGKGNGDTQYGGAYASTTGLSNEDSRRLAELLAQRDDMVRAQRLAEARELANTVATAAAAEGATFAQIAAEMGFSLEQLAKDLGINAESKLGIEEYLARIDVTQDDIPDSITSNTDRMIAKMDEIWGSGAQSSAMGVNGKPIVNEVADVMTAFVRTRGEVSDAKSDVLIDKSEDMVMALRELVGLYREALGNSTRSMRTGEAPFMPR